MKKIFKKIIPSFIITYLQKRKHEKEEIDKYIYWRVKKINEWRNLGFNVSDDSFSHDSLKKEYLKNNSNVDELKYFVQDSVIQKSTIISHNCTIVESVFGNYNKIGSYSYLCNVTFNDFSYNSIRCTIQNAQIGKFCSIAQDVSIGLGKHPSEVFISSHPSFYSTHKQCGFTFADKQYFDESGKVKIGNDVWIGTGSIILDDVKIGNGAIVAANSVVTADVPPYAIVGGTPAKVIKYRFSEEDIVFLENVKWWDKDMEWLKNNFKKLHNIELLKNEFSAKK